MSKYVATVAMAIVTVMTMAMSARPSLPAGVYDPRAPHAPSGYVLTYGHNFTSQGRGD